MKFTRRGRSRVRTRGIAGARRDLSVEECYAVLLRPTLAVQPTSSNKRGRVWAGGFTPGLTVQRAQR